MLPCANRMGQLFFVRPVFLLLPLGKQLPYAQDQHKYGKSLADPYRMQGICKPYAQERAHHAKRRAFQGEFVVDQTVLHVDVDRDRGKGQEKDQVDAARLHLLHPEELKKLEAFAGDGAVLARLDEIKRANKLDFAAYVKKTQGVALNTDAIFDVQVKRLHEYKRQLLNAMHIIYLYQKLQDDPSMELQPRTFLFGAKAAPGYAVAKRIIHLINSLANQINSDPLCRGRLQVVFLENYRVSLAEHLMPASEVSQQISTAGKEASGTGNMKFMMNGALTVGTLDGANVEMHEVLGDENMFLFGLHADEVARLKAQGYAPQRLCEHDDALKRVVDQLRTGFSDGVSYDDLAQRLLQRDEYMLLQDFASYCAAEQRMAKTYADRAAWDRMSLLNIARSSIFAADRAVAQYADNIWHVPHK